MMQKKYLFLFLGLLGLNFIAGAQKTPGYPQDYFRNPLDIPMLLAGNFGECRPNHFHSGIDIKTGSKENLPIYAVADGYISRIKMEPGGFGHALYVAHPNGYTTVYAHLNDFMPEVQRYVRKEQYKQESWTLDMTLSAKQFPVKKGDRIAWSGNTGSSSAPHLHFEIRDTKTEHPLNPLLFGFEINDNIAPRPTQVAVYDMTKGIYEQTPRMFTLQKNGEIYTTDTIYVNKQEIGLGLVTNDFMNGSDNTLTYHTADVFMNEAPFISIRLDDIGYDVTRYMNAFADYKTKKQTGKWVQCLFQMDGNRLDNIYTYATDYRRISQRGQLEFGNELPKKVRIELADAAGNKTSIAFHVVYKSSADSSARNCEESRHFLPGRNNNFSNKNIDFTLDDKALYEPICFEFKKTAHANGYSDRYMLHHAYVPVHTSFELKIKPDRPMLPNMQSKIALIYNDGKEETGKAARYENGWYKTSARNFGEYRLVTDNEPPIIKALQKEGANLSKARRISFNVEDEITSVKKFRAELDGKWLLFEQSGDVFFYEFDEHCPKGKHTLMISATDENNNKRSFSYNFTR